MASLPVRLPPLQERGEALLALVGRAPLGDPARRLGAVRALAHESFRPARRLRCCREQLVDDALHGGIEVVRDLTDQADAQRGRGIEALAGDEVPACVAA